MKNKNNQVWVDYTRVLATFCVVFLHSAAPLLYKYNNLPEINWWIANAYDSVVRVSVPLFFMLSGYLLLEKNEPLKVFFLKRFNKVVVPLLAWSIFYVFWKAYYESSSQLSLYSFFSIALSPAYYHLWFLYAIIGLYLFMPILRVVVNNSDKNIINYYLLLWFFAVALIPAIQKLTGIFSRIDLLSISGYSGFLVMGLMLGKYRCSTKVAIASVFIFLACAGITCIGTYFLTIRNKGVFSGYFYEYQSPNVVVASAAAFVLIKYLIENNTFFHRPPILSVMQSLSSASLGIYFVHTTFLYLLKSGDLGFTLYGFIGNPIYTIPATAMTAFFLSYITIVVIKKIPLLNRIAP